jgi:hypothetical protein
MRDWSHLAAARSLRFQRGRLRGFCPDVSVCQTGQALYATDGTAVTITYPFIIPLFSTFSSTLLPVTSARKRGPL